VALQLFELLEDKKLFVHLKSQKGMYTAQAHIAEMIALLGPPPQKLIDEERQWRDVPWERSFPSIDGAWCNTAREYYGGPFFDSKGMSTYTYRRTTVLISKVGYFTFPQIIPKRIMLDDCISCMAGEEKALFLSFVRKMLQWLPEDRETARELRKDPWLQSGLQ
jgi:hypothetical protein